MSGEYVPTTDVVRTNYALDEYGGTSKRWEAEFDRWLTTHDAALRAEVAREIREWARNIHPDTAPLETNAQAEKFLGDLAARIARSRSEA